MPACGRRDAYLTHAEVARRLDRAAEAIGLELDEVLALQRAVLPERFESAPPAAPAGGIPGTPEKVRTLTERAAAGQSLWHPADAPDGLDTALEVTGDGTNHRRRTGAVCCLRVTGEGYRVRGYDGDAPGRGTQEAPPAPEGLLTRAQLARALGVAPETVGRWRKEGRIPRSTSADGRQGYSLREVRAALEAAGHRLPS
jgi:hypothetical protein